MAAGMSFGGHLSDRRGPGFPFVVGSLLFAGGLLGAGISPSMGFLIAFRALQGAGSGLVNAGTYAMVASRYPENLRAKMLALLSSAWALPALIGPVWAVFISNAIGWRYVFLFVIPLPLLAAGCARFSIREFDRVRVSSGPGILKYSLQFAFGIALISGLLTFASQGNLKFLFFLPVSLFVLIPGISGILKGKSEKFRRILFLMIALNASFFGVDGFLPLLLNLARNDPGSFFGGGAITAASLCWILGAWIQSHLLARISRRTLSFAGFIPVIAGVSLSGLVLTYGNIPMWWIVGAWGLAGGGMGLAYNTINLIAMGEASSAGQGEDIAVIQLGGVLGMGMGTGAGSVLFASFSSLREFSGAPFLHYCSILTILLLSALPSAARLHEERPLRD